MINKCPMCKNINLSIIYSVDNMPIFQHMVYNDVSSAKEATTSKGT